MPESKPTKAEAFEARIRELRGDGKSYAEALREAAREMPDGHAAWIGATQPPGEPERRRAEPPPQDVAAARRLLAAAAGEADPDEATHKRLLGFAKCFPGDPAFALEAAADGLTLAEAVERRRGRLEAAGDDGRSETLAAWAELLRAEGSRTASAWSEAARRCPKAEASWRAAGCGMRSAMEAAGPSWG